MNESIEERLNNAPCGFLSFNDDGEIILINNTLCEILKYKPEELQQKKLKLILPVASVFFYQTYFFPLLKFHGKAEEMYFSLRAKDKKDIPMLVNGIRREYEGTFLNECIFIAINQRIQYEDEILKAKKAAEMAIFAQKEAESELRKLYQQLQIELEEKKRAETIIFQQAKRENLLKNMTQKIHESINLVDIFQIATDGIREYFDVERVGIFKFDDDLKYNQGEFIFESVKDNFSSILGIKVQDHCFAEQYVHLYQQGKYQAIEDIYQAGFEDCHVEILAKLQIRANLIISILKHEELWGLLCVHQCTKPRTWQQFEIDFVQQIANQVAIAIQQKELFQQLQKVNQELADSNIELHNATQAKSLFLANMSHEIRTPMNGVIGIAQLLALTNLTPEQKDLVETIQISGKTLLTVINDILDFSKIESGMLQLDKQPFIFADIFKSVCDLLYKQVQDQNISLTYEIDENIAKMLIGDSCRLQQIMLNLVGNAIKFTEFGSVRIFAEKRKQAKENEKNLECELLIGVEDTGIGISGDRIDKLFQSFTQADSSISRKYGGTGLGLTISKSLIELMDGTIWVESLGNIAGKPPENWQTNSCLIKGSTFYFTIKLQAISIHELIANNHHHKSLELALNHKPNSLKILLAEDNKINQKVAILTLKKLGYQADIANNGLEVLEMLEKQDYEVILMDMQMPKMDGVTATQKIRESNRKQPYIIALTANALQEDRDLCTSVGMNDYLNKPIDIVALKEALTQILN